METVPILYMSPLTLTQPSGTLLDDHVGNCILPCWQLGMAGTRCVSDACFSYLL